MERTFLSRPTNTKNEIGVSACQDKNGSDAVTEMRRMYTHTHIDRVVNAIQSNLQSPPQLEFHKSTLSTTTTIMATTTPVAMMCTVSQPKKDAMVYVNPFLSNRSFFFRKKHHPTTNFVVTIVVGRKFRCISESCKQGTFEFFGKRHWNPFNAKWKRKKANKMAL